VALAPERAAAELERVFQAAGLPTRISPLGIPRESLPAVVAHSLKNFNADPKREFLKEQAMLAELIQACW
jgi:alcohol dehydrogenase class IV